MTSSIGFIILSLFLLVDSKLKIALCDPSNTWGGIFYTNCSTWAPLFDAKISLIKSLFPDSTLYIGDDNIMEGIFYCNVTPLVFPPMNQYSLYDAWFDFCDAVKGNYDLIWFLSEIPTNFTQTIEHTYSFWRSHVKDCIRNVWPKFIFGGGTMEFLLWEIYTTLNIDSIDLNVVWAPNVFNILTFTNELDRLKQIVTQKERTIIVQNTTAASDKFDNAKLNGFIYPFDIKTLNSFFPVIRNNFNECLLFVEFNSLPADSILISKFLDMAEIGSIKPKAVLLGYEDPAWQQLPDATTLKRRAINISITHDIPLYLNVQFGHIFNTVSVIFSNMQATVQVISGTFFITFE